MGKKAKGGGRGNGDGGAGKRGRAGRGKRREDKLVLTYDADDRAEYLTGFRKRRMLRQAKAAEELKRKERAERIKLRKEYRKEVKDMVAQRGVQLDAHGIAHTPVETEKAQEKFESPQHLVTVTTVQYGFGDDGAGAAVATESTGGRTAGASANDSGSSILQKAQNSQLSISALKKAAYRKAASAQAHKPRQPKEKRSRKTNGAVPKQGARGKRSKRERGRGRGKSRAE